MWTWIKAGCLLAGSAMAAFGADSALNDARTTLEKWVETRQLIGKTRADWQTDKELLAQTAELLQRELQSIQEQRGKLSTNSTQVDKERAEAEASLQVANESLDAIRKFADGFEKQLVPFVSRLPNPLQEIIKPFLNRLPSDASAARITVAERVQAMVGILNEIDKFNNAVTIFGERRKNEKGEEVSVDTVYVGLGAAYFVNSTGDLAGVGTPGPNGWEWAIKPELAKPVQEVIRIYRNERSARFVSLPVTLR
jgi:hypothetical protein